MKLDVVLKEQSQKINLDFGERNQDMNVDFRSIETRTHQEHDYSRLINKPYINGVELMGFLTAEDLGLGRAYYDTTANWEMKGSEVSQRGALYIYSDYAYTEDEDGHKKPVPGIRIGDGLAYIRDLPFIATSSQDVMKEIQAINAEIASIEQILDTKVSAELSELDSENLVLF